jgi:hypothetical protein
LNVELWDKQTEKATSVLVGTARLSLAEVLNAEPKHIMVGHNNLSNSFS